MRTVRQRRFAAISALILAPAVVQRDAVAQTSGVVAPASSVSPSAASGLSITGKVTEFSLSGSPLSGVTINVTGSQTLSTTSDLSGNYNINLPPGIYRVSASRAGYAFGPASGPVVTSQVLNWIGNPVAGLTLVPVTPCRLVDTRVRSFPSGFGPPSLKAGNVRTFDIAANTGCGIPSSAAAYSLNVTAVTTGYLGYLTLWPAGETMPNVSTLNSYSNTSTAVANAAIVPAGSNGGLSVFASDTADLIIDINGYFVPPPTQGLVFYPVTPCRTVDTRVASFPPGFGPPSMAAGMTRSFNPRSDSGCGIPPTAAAYSLNVTAVPQKTLGFLSIWPAGQPLPNISTLNVYTPGTVVANAAIVPAGSGGAINTYVTDATDLVIDINGYFARPGGAPPGLKFYPTTPCRAADTRYTPSFLFQGPFGPPPMTAGEQRSFPIAASVCGVPGGAGAYALNFTALPQAAQLGIFSVWPTGQPLPNVSTMNSYNGSPVANAAVVPVGSNGAISIFVTDPADVLIDINGYFAQ